MKFVWKIGKRFIPFGSIGISGSFRLKKKRDSRNFNTRPMMKCSALQFEKEMRGLESNRWHIANLKKMVAIFAEGNVLLRNVSF